MDRVLLEGMRKVVSDAFLAGYEHAGTVGDPYDGADEYAEKVFPDRTGKEGQER